MYSPLLQRAPQSVLTVLMMAMVLGSARLVFPSMYCWRTLTIPPGTKPSVCTAQQNVNHAVELRMEPWQHVPHARHTWVCLSMMESAITVTVTLEN